MRCSLIPCRCMHGIVLLGHNPSHHCQNPPSTGKVQINRLVSNVQTVHGRNGWNGVGLLDLALHWFAFWHYLLGQSFDNLELLVSEDESYVIGVSSCCKIPGFRIRAKINAFVLEMVVMSCSYDTPIDNLVTVFIQGLEPHGVPTIIGYHTYPPQPGFPLEEGKDASKSR